MLRHRVITYFLIWGICVTVAYLPFLFGLMLPSFIDRHPYSIFFSMFNFPVTFALGEVIRWLGEYIWQAPDRYQKVLSQFYVTVAFWSILGGTIGLIRDLTGDRGR
ncbi:MAG TPA: hypothetical protein VJO14_04695 [Bacteroidota bacterium]|nr:hypothetical protein [Bacteroidota bacterium]